MKNGYYWAKSTNIELLEFLAGSRSLQVDIEWFRILRQKEIYNNKWHTHSNTEIHFIFEGSIQFYFQNTMIEVPGGSAIFIPARCNHRLYNPHGDQFHECVLNCGFQMVHETPEGLFIENAYSHKEPFPFRMDTQLRNLLDLCIAEDRKRTSGFVTAIESCLMLIILNVARELTGWPEATYPISERVDLVNMRSKQVLEYIEQNPRISLNLPQIAAHVGLSVRQIQRVMRLYCNTTISNVVQGICLKQAKTLLKDPAMSIAAIAFELDFANEQSFTRFFRREEGVSPNQYRQSIMPPPEHFAIK